MDIPMAPPSEDPPPRENYFMEDSLIDDEDLQTIFNIPFPARRVAGQERTPTRQLLVTDNGLFDTAFLILNNAVSQSRKFFEKFKGNFLHSRVAFLVYGYSTTPDWSTSRDSRFHWTWHKTIHSFVGNIFDREAQRQRMIGVLRRLIMDAVSLITFYGYTII